MTIPVLHQEEPVKLILNRRAIAAGLAALIATPAVAKEKLAQVIGVPLDLDSGAFGGTVRDGLFLPDYRFPRCRLVFSDGSYTAWNAYHGHGAGVRNKQEYVTGGGKKRAVGSTPAFMEVCCPDKNGMPRYAQLAIG